MGIHMRGKLFGPSLLSHKITNTHEFMWNSVAKNKLYFTDVGLDYEKKVQFCSDK